MYKFIDELAQSKTLAKEDMKQLLISLLHDTKEQNYLHAKAREVSTRIFNHKVYIRGLIEISNYCQNDCYYCGIRNSNSNLHRYRLSFQEILDCCKEGYELGFYTFVLQGGEDLYYNDDRMCKIIYAIKAAFPQCAVTLSLGEKKRSTYEKYKKAGADRYLLRHETINDMHYSLLHPHQLKLKNRIQCLYDLKDIGFQVGSGIMVGSPYQNLDMIIEDIYFLTELPPEMIGIGPFLPHQDTPFHDQQPGSVELTLILISIFRLMHPYALIPATTALSTIHKEGKEMGILAGANVVMPNLTPMNRRKDYMLYDHKACTQDEAKEGLSQLKEKMKRIGYEIVNERGDYHKNKEEQ